MKLAFFYLFLLGLTICSNAEASCDPIAIPGGCLGENADILQRMDFTYLPAEQRYVLPAKLSSLNLHLIISEYHGKIRSITYGTAIGKNYMTYSEFENFKDQIRSTNDDRAWTKRWSERNNFYIEEYENEEIKIIMRRETVIFVSKSPEFIE